MSRARGQTLVMFALMLLFLSLTVMVTLGIANRVHERMEAQVAADASAYSQAILTARTFNAISLINRAVVGKMVAMAAVESLISWTGASYGNIIALQTAATKAQTAIAAGGDPQGCSAALTNLQTALTAAKTNADVQWVGLDEAAGQQVLSLQGSASALRDVQVKLLSSLVGQLAEKSTNLNPSPILGSPVVPPVTGNNMVLALAQGANTELKTPANKEGDWKSVMEVIAASGVSAATLTGTSVDATLGSIGDPFVAARNNSASDFASYVSTKYNIVGFAGTGGKGGAGFGEADFHSAEQHLQASSYAAWAHDEGGSFNFTLTCAAGIMPLTGTTQDAFVYSSEQQQSDDKHRYEGWTDPTHSDDLDANASTAHTLGSCVVCDGIWPFFMDYALSAAAPVDSENRALNNAKNLWGQPVLFSVLERDYSTVKDDPWSMNFTFHFAQNNAAGTLFDNGNHSSATGKVQLGLTDANYAAYTRQVVLSAGLAYYHRFGHAREPPNFFNPFWRATLIPAEIDTVDGVNSGAGGDAVTALQKAGYGQHAAALQALEKKGYAVTELSP